MRVHVLNASKSRPVILSEILVNHDLYSFGLVAIIISDRFPFGHDFLVIRLELRQEGDQELGINLDKR